MVENSDSLYTKQDDMFGHTHTNTFASDNRFPDGSTHVKLVSYFFDFADIDVECRITRKLIQSR